MTCNTSRLGLVVCCLVCVLSLAVACGAVEGDNYVTFEFGSDADVDGSKLPFVQKARMGEAGAEDDVKYRLTMPNVFQVYFTFPAFDFDPELFGAIQHPFYLTVKYKDTANQTMKVFALKGGEGFYGGVFIGNFGGAADGKWKEETLVIPRSSLRCMDGKTFQVKFGGIKTPVPLASMTLFSAETTLPGAADKIAEAYRCEAAKLEELRTRLKASCNDLGLPDPDATPAYSAEEKTRGFRVFFPAINQQLFSNSQPATTDLKTSLDLYVCPGETQSFMVAVRGLKDVGTVTIDWKDPFAKTATSALEKARREYLGTRWAVYSEQRAGASWGKDYRVVPEQLVLGDSQVVGPQRLEIACLSFEVPADTPAGDHEVSLTLSSEKGGAVTVPVKITVYPFKLEHPAHSTHGQFYYCNGADLNPFEVRDMADHGMDTMVAGLGVPVPGSDTGPIRSDATRQALQELRDLGYRAPLHDNVTGTIRLTTDDNNRKRFTRAIAETLKVAKEVGFDEMGFFPFDEPHKPEDIASALKACTWIKDVKGANTYITSNPQAVKVLDPVLNYVCYQLGNIEESVIKGMKPHQTAMWYCPSFDFNPQYNRYHAGFYLFRTEAHSSQYFAYMNLADNPYCDLDGGNRDWTVVYPSLMNPFPDPTVQWQSMREGVADYGYACTLKTLAERATKKGKRADAAKALKVLEGVVASVNPSGKRAGGPALVIEGDVRLKGKQADPKELAREQALARAGWYDESRRKIAQAVVELKRVLGEQN